MQVEVVTFSSYTPVAWSHSSPRQIFLILETIVLSPGKQPQIIKGEAREKLRFSLFCGFKSRDFKYSPKVFTICIFK
jgi:hypothetical protein